MKTALTVSSLFRWLSRIWEGLVEPARVNNPGEHRLARALNSSLIFLITWGIVTEAAYRSNNQPFGSGEFLTIVMMVSFGLSYFLNRSGRFYTALILAIVALAGATFTLALIQHFSHKSDLSVLYYLIIAILMSELFFSMRGFILAASIILAGVFGIYLLHEDATIFLFLLIFSALVGFSSYNRRLAERERLALAGKSAQDRSLLLSERHRARQVELLNQITQTTLQTSNLHDALQTLADQLGQIMEADGAFITLWDAETERVLPASAYGDYRNTYPNMKLEPGENTLTASVLREGRVIPVVDVWNTPYMNPQLASDVPTRSALGLPLIVNDRKLGAALISFNETRQFTDEDISIGEQAATQIALAIFKAQLFENESRRAAQLELLEEVGRRIADSFDEKEILQRALEAVVDKFGYAEAAISLLTDNGFLEVTAITGTEDFGYRPGYRQEMGKGIIGHVAQSRTSYIANDVSKDPYYYSTARRHGSAAAVPMLNNDQLLGVIYVETTRPADFFTVDDIQTLQTLANQVATSLQKARLYATIQEHLNIMTTLQSVSQVVMSSLELSEILRNVIELLKNSFGYTYISVYLLNGNVLRLGAELGYPQDFIIREIPISIGIIGKAVRTKTTQHIRDVTDDPDFLRASYEVKSEICVPLLKKGDILGVLNVESKEDRPLEERDVNVLTALAGPLAIAVDNARLHAEVKTMALTDTLSGLANRRAFDEILHTELMRADRYRDHLSLIILDLDSFKEFNDLYGHPAGDVRLKEIGEMLKENVREPDLAARYGGEEFAIILPSTSKEGAIKLAERLRRSAETKAPVVHNNHATPGYTISLGVATFPDDAVTLKDLLLAADNAELAAKRLGKNRVQAANSLDRHTT